MTDLEIDEYIQAYNNKFCENRPSYIKAFPLYEEKSPIETYIIDDFEICKSGELLTYNDDEEYKEELIVPDGIKAIGLDSFQVNMVNKIVLPQSLEIIESGALHVNWYDKLDKVEFGSNLRRCPAEIIPGYDIKEDLLNSNSCYVDEGGLIINTNTGCLLFADKDIVKAEIPSYVKEIGSNAFRDCELLKEVIIPDSVRIIGDCAFMSCNSLEKVTVPVSVELLEFFGNSASISGNTFKDCKTLKECKIKGKLKTLPGEIFLGCNSLESVSLPDSIEVIGSDAFNGCKKLKMTAMPKNTKIIQSCAF